MGKPSEVLVRRARDSSKSASDKSLDLVSSNSVITTEEVWVAEGRDLETKEIEVLLESLASLIRFFFS